VANDAPGNPSRGRGLVRKSNRRRGNFPGGPHRRNV